MSTRQACKPSPGSLNDGELQNLMHALSRRSTQDSQRHSSRERPPMTTTQRDRGNQRQSRIPPAIFDLIPTHNGLPVCLRYLSAMGCPSGSSNRCVYGARAHAAPDTLDVRVKVIFSSGWAASASGSRIFEGAVAAPGSSCLGSQRAQSTPTRHQSQRSSQTP